MVRGLAGKSGGKNAVFLIVLLVLGVMVYWYFQDITSTQSILGTAVKDFSMETYVIDYCGPDNSPVWSASSIQIGDQTFKGIRSKDGQSAQYQFGSSDFKHTLQSSQDEMINPYVRVKLQVLRK
jgi:hypothetical protein